MSCELRICPSREFVQLLRVRKRTALEPNKISTKTNQPFLWAQERSVAQDAAHVDGDAVVAMRKRWSGGSNQGK
eukprot:gene13268-biopygen20017